MRINLLLAALTLTLFSSCGPAVQESRNKPLIVCTTGMITDAVKQIGGDSVEVISLMGPGVDPHLYKATQGDLKKLQEADVIFYNGLRLEGKMGEVLEKLAAVKTVVPVAATIDSSRLMADPVYDQAYDPHIWFDVSLWRQTLETVRTTLSDTDPESQEYFSSNANNYAKELKNLHEWVSEHVGRIPQQQRILVTAHDAFNYFGKAYNIKVRGLQGISTLSEFGLKDRVELVKFIVKNKIPAVFVETSVSQKNIQSIVEACGQKGHKVIIGGNLYSDAMGAAGTPEGTYVGMVKSNVNTIVSSLAPEPVTSR
jgi:manganese/zinc/iron transport system substrate-binding protein